MIKQRSWGDCGVVALLNAFQNNGISFYNRPGGYEDMVSTLNGRDHGITIQEVCAVLFEHGFLPVHLPLDGFAVASGIENVKSCRLKTVNDSFMSDWPKAIYQVKTLSGMLHYIYFDGSLIWDGAVNSPIYPSFSDYASVVDVVYLLPNTPFSKYSPSEERTAFFLAQMEAQKEIDSCTYESPNAQKIAEYEAARKDLRGPGVKSSIVLKPGDELLTRVLDPGDAEMVMNIIRTKRL